MFRATHRPIIEALESRQLLAATHLRIDAGGSGFIGAGGKSWQADRGFSGGSAIVAPYEVGKTSDDKLFYTAREGTFGYSLAVTNGNYKLRLSFADATSTAAGQRRFSVSAEKEVVLRNADLFASAGAKSAYVRTFNVTVRDGRLSLWFQGTRGNATVSAIELIPVSPLGLQWTKVADAPIPRFESMSASVGGKLYVIAGFHTADIRTTKRSDAYDPAKGTWTQIADAPEALSHSGVATDGSRIYLAGGFVGDWKGINTPVTNHVWIYNATTDSWSAGVSLPAARGAGALVRVGRKLHFFGGVDAGINDSGTHWVLDLRGGTWKVAASLPNPRNHLGYVNYQGKIFAIGGQHQLDEANGNDTSVHVYDPSTNAWHAITSLPAPQSHIHNSTFVWNDRITMIGGSTVGHVSIANLTQYDPKRNKWVTIGYLPGPRSAATAALVDGHIVVSGGTLTEISPQKTTWILA
jgi:N-acetylneuraminic acid mutarotase